MQQQRPTVPMFLRVAPRTKRRYEREARRRRLSQGALMDALMQELDRAPSKELEKEANYDATVL